MFTQILKGEKVSKERALQILPSDFEKYVHTRPDIIIFIMNDAFGSADKLFTNIVNDNDLPF